MALPESARAGLAAELIDSLDPARDDDYEESWSEEIKRRLELHDGGVRSSALWPEARARIVGE